MAMMRDLLVTTCRPALSSGRALRTYGVARALAAHGGLDLLYVKSSEEPDEAFRSIPGIALHEVTPTRGARRLQAYAGARLRGVPKGFARGVSAELTLQAERMAQESASQNGQAGGQRGRVIADGPEVAAALWWLAGRRRVIYNAHNLESAFRHELRARSVATRIEERALRSYERRLLARFAESWMVSEADMAGARALCPTAHLRYAPNVVDVAAIPATAQLSDEQRAIFVASFYYEPNRRGLRFLLEEVFPRVWAQLPTARLTLAGTGLDGPASADPRVETLGFVADLTPLYASARCALVPLLQGGGTPLKLIEALAHGLPVVATSRAAAGLHLHDGEDCLLADDGESFAAAIVRVLRDGGQSYAPAFAAGLGQRGRELVAQRYSIEALTAMLAEE
jgi:glycosyltransferase involved in cell wall biosynthesis